MKEKTVYPFTAAQFKALTEEERKAVLAVAEYLTSSAIDISDEQLSEALNLMKPAEGCVPSEEADEDLLNTVRRKIRGGLSNRDGIAKPSVETIGQLERLDHDGFSRPGHSFLMTDSTATSMPTRIWYSPGGPRPISGSGAMFRNRHAGLCCDIFFITCFGTL